MDYTEKETLSSKPAVLLAAPTGLAAIQIHGATIHSLFSIRVQHGRDREMEGLSSERLNEKRVLMSNCRLLIIDETSMCSNILLTKIHLRLSEIRDSDVVFGGMNVLMFGDLMQLPPVQAARIFEPLPAHQVNFLNF